MGPVLPQGPISGGTGISAGADVNVGPVDVSVTANVSAIDLLGFDVSLGADGIFVGAEIEIAQLLSTEPLGLNPVQIVEATTGLALSHLLDSDLPGIDDLLGSGEHLSQIKATLAEVTGLSLVSAIGPSADGLLPQALAQPAEALLGASLTPIQVVSELAELGFDGPSADLSSGGLITFPLPAGNAVAQIDDLFAGRQYTDYSLALQSEQKSSTQAVPATGASEPIDPTVITSSLENVSPGHDSGDLPNAAPVSLALEDINERGLSL